MAEPMAGGSQVPGRGDPDALRRRLAQPRGQLELFGATLAVAVVIASVAASQRPFFERYIQEKYPTPSAQAAELATELESQEGKPTTLSESEWSGLYHLYMTSTDDRYRHLPRALLRADAERTGSRLVRSWHAGSDAQRHRVLAFLRDAGDPALAFAIEIASRRSRPASTDLSRALQQTRDSLPPLREK